MAVCRNRDRITHSDCLHAGKLENLIAAQPKKIEGTEQEGLKTEHQPKVKGQEVHCKFPKQEHFLLLSLFIPSKLLAYWVVLPIFRVIFFPQFVD